MKFVQDLSFYVGCDTGMFRQVLFPSGVLHLVEGREPSVGRFIKVTMLCKGLDIWFYIVNITEEEIAKFKASSDEEIIKLAFDNLKFSPEMLVRLYDSGYEAGIQYTKRCMGNFLSKI